MDEDLKALRSAALASLSSKAEQISSTRDEEDLDTLRKAALMTRKQNQIQVIQRQSESHQRPTIPMPLPMVPSLKNIPPPPLLIPPPLHSISIPPPPIFSHPIIVRNSVPVWATNNLISLTPGLPGPTLPNFLMPRNTQRPIMAQAPHLSVRRVFPRVAAMTDTRFNIRKPAVKAPNISEDTEQKVPDKFSRYDPDSSSEDEEEHSSAKKKDGDASDAESITSKKSCSSVSDANDTLDASTGVDEEKQKEDKEDSKQDEVDSDPGTPLQDEPCDDDISIIGDEDDILAAIDDFLEDRPEKKEPKKITSRKNSNKKGKTKVKTTPIVFEQSTIAKPTVAQKSRPGVSSSICSKAEETKTNEVKQPDKSFERNVTATVNIKPAGPGNRDNPSQKSKEMARKQSRATVSVPVVRTDDAYTIPVVSKRMAPSPHRQRRDSDLDSVGTSDLSFLSSDEDERKPEMKRVPQKRPRTRSVSDEMERRRNERLKKETRSSDAPPKSRSTQGPVKHRGSQDKVGRDLRKKLENKGVKRVTVVADQQSIEPVKVQKNRLDNKSNPKRGVISLKTKSSNTSNQSAKISSKATDRKIVVTARSQSNAQAVNTGVQQNDQDSSAVTIRTPKKTIVREKNVKRMRFSELSPIVAPLNPKVLIKSVPRKTMRLKCNEKPILRKPSVSSKQPAGKIVDASEKETSNIEESSMREAANENEEDLFHEEEIFSFNQDIADYDDVLGDITEEVEVTPKARRKFSYNATKGTEYGIVEANSTARGKKGKIRQEREPKATAEGTKDRGKVSIHQRLGRQPHHDLKVDDPLEFDTDMFTGNKRRVLVSRLPSPEDNEVSGTAGSTQDRIGSTVKLLNTDKGPSSKRGVLHSHCPTTVSVKRIRKKPSSSPSTESVLEKRIRRIKQQNGKILKRQMEIQKEKEKFG